jgi:ATP-dependent exoDNAse (exonuclease V) beta subunit
MNNSQIIVVQASAGSGKTYNLAKRYVYLLLNSDDDTAIKNIVAVTFTNKAVVEMKYRVINYLKKGALFLDTGDFFNDLKLSKNEISKKSAAILKNILKSYDNFNISTIDSFKNHILKVCAINIDISPNFTIEQDYSANLLFSLENFLQMSQESENLRDILLQYLSQYLMTDSGWIPKKDIYNEIKKVFNKSGNTGKDISVVMIGDYSCEFSSRVKIIMEKIKSFSDILPKLKIYYRYNRAIENVLCEGEKLFFSMKVSEIFAKEELQYKRGAEVNLKADEMWREINREIKSLYGFYMENYYSVYSFIYSKVAIEFDIQSKRDGVVFLNEINKKTVNLFAKNNSIIPELYYRLSERYKHFLIDEFQDTSFVQWIGMKSFLEEILASGGTFFYVGDVKQAIYAFRGGKPELFNEVLNELPSAYIENRFLKQNFRSGKNVVDFNNNIFSKKNIERLLNEVYKNEDNECDFSRFAETYKFSDQEVVKEHNYGYVEINIIDKKCENIREEIKQKLMNYISELLKRFNPKNIVVLCRTNDEILDVSSWLLEDGLEIESSQTLNIKNNIVVKQILSFFMFINSPIDALAFSSFVMGDIFSKISKIESNELEKFIFLCNKDNSIRTLYKIFSNKYKNLCEEYFEDFFIKAGFMPVYELLLAVLEKFKIIDNFPESKAFIMCFLEFIKEFETHDSGLKNFLEYFGLNSNANSLYVKVAFGNGIKVMTIHKSKGLQFPVVIMPFLKLSDAKIDIPYFDDSGEEIKVLGISKNIAKFSTKAKKIYDSAKLNALLSELNMLYVSMTRAEYELYAIVPPKVGAANNSASILFGGEKNIVSGIKQKYNLNDVINDNVVLDTFDKSYKDIQKYLMNEKTRTLDINDIATKGIIIHYALSTVISLENKNINDVISNAVKTVKRRFFFENVDFVKEKLERLFSSQEVFRLFMYDIDKVYNEKEVVNADGESFRIDKLIVTDSEVMIVDFKISDHDEIKNRKQLNDYVSLVSEIYLSKRVFAYIVDIENANCLLLQ